MTFLSVPKKFPEAYRKSVAELERRAAYDYFISYLAGKMDSSCKEEQQRRKEFNST